MVFIIGEPGIGKTTLVDALAAYVVAADGVRVVQGLCVGPYSTGEAYRPILEALGRLCRSAESRPLIPLFQQYAPMWLAQMPWLLSEAEQERLQRTLAGTTQTRMLRELAEVLEVITNDKPLVLILENLHRSDYATMDALTMLAQRREPARLMIVGTYRPVEGLQRAHPLQAVIHELRYMDCARNSC